MRLNVPTSITYGGTPGAGTFGAFQQGQNALLQQLYQNQIARAQAQNAPANQLALTQQNQGAAQNALAQGANAPAIWSGNAAAAQGIGAQEQAAGIYAAPLAQQALQQQIQASLQAGMTSQEIAIELKRLPGMTDAALATAMAGAQIAHANAVVAPQAAKANIINTLHPTLSTALSHPKSAAGLALIPGNPISAAGNVLASLPTLNTTSSMGYINSLPVVTDPQTGISYHIDKAANKAYRVTQ